MLTPPPKVLIVEDEGIVALDLRQSLGHLGYDPYAIASTGDEALRRAAEACPDVVLMDIRIEGTRDGIETATLLRQRFDVPVVFLTAHADGATVDRAKRAEPYGYLLKPVRESELRSAIEVALYKHGMERRLRERERWFATTLRSIGDAVIAVDLKGGVTFLNPAAERVLGLDAGEALGRPARELLHLREPYELESPLDHVLRARTNLVVENATLVDAGGVERTISDTASMVMDDAEPLGAVMVFRDVTEQRRLEQRVELSERLASLGTLAAGVAHEVNNPLSVIAGNITFVSDQLSDRRARLDESEHDERDLLDALLAAQSDAVEAVRRISRIVGDLRTFSRPQPSRGHAAVAEAIAFAVRITASQFHQRAQVRVEDGAPGAQVALADVRLEQVLINLLVNAVHAMPPGRSDGVVTVRARSEAGRVVIEVADNGTGIPPAVIKRVFEPFFTTKEAGSGTGLGLAICHGIVTAAGGTIEVESQEGRGSVFRVSLPRATEPAPPPAVAPAEPAASAARRRGGRIMVIDDEPMILDVMRRILVGHEVVCLPDARAALATLDRDPDFAIIFSDLAMPAMSGVEFYEAVLARSPELARRIVFLTGGATSARGEAFLLVVPNARLHKPIYPDVLTRFVRERLAAAGATGGG